MNLRKVILILFLCLFQQNIFAIPQDLVDYKKQIYDCTLKKLYQNISPPGTLKGTVVASPSKYDPNYFYHWVRDGALVMDTLRFIGITKEHESFLELSKIHQSKESEAFAGLGEPKFEVDGGPFKGGWGRPQNDGPAERALTLGLWGINQNLDLLKNKIFPVIEKDLNYLMQNLWVKDFDLWEETVGHHFFTKIIQYKAFHLGIKLAKKIGRLDLINPYQSKMNDLKNHLLKYFDSQKKYFRITLDQENNHYKNSGLDSASILGFIYFSELNDEFLNDPSFVHKIMSSAGIINHTFKNIYSINQNNNYSPGIGRYPEDKYNGYETSGEGNPWFLATLGFSEFIFYLHDYHNKQGEIVINDLTQNFWKEFTTTSFANKEITITKNNPEFNQYQEKLLNFGYGYLRRAKYHSDMNKCALSEQMNRYSGYMQGANDLTWSYASLLRTFKRLFDSGH